MNRVLALIEGQTEERFVKDVLQPHLWPKGISLEPKIVTTKQVIGGASHKGGGDFSKIISDARRLLNDSNAVAVTTFFDFYGFPRNIPDAVPMDFDDIDRLEAAINKALPNPRFRPYLQRHEFEAFLFVDAALTARSALQPDCADAIDQHRKQFETVEDINNNPETAPSKRLMHTLHRFSKLQLGPTGASRLGIDRLRHAAPRFSNWLAWMESLSGSPALKGKP